jgi:hypothetical protein
MNTDACIDHRTMTKNKTSEAYKAKKNARAADHQLGLAKKALVERDLQEAADAVEAESGWTLANEYSVQQSLDDAPIIVVDDDESVAGPAALPAMGVPMVQAQFDYAAWPRLSKEEFFKMLAEQQQQQHKSQGTKRPAPSDGHHQRTAPVPPQGSKHLGQVTFIESLVAREQERLRKTSSGDGTGSQSTRNPTPATLPPRVPQPPGGSYDYYAEIDEYHAECGLPPLADCHNGMIETLPQYGKCSRAYHELLCLLGPQNRMTMRNHVQRWHSRASVQDGCISVAPHTIYFQHDCPDCGHEIGMHLRTQRIVAIVAEHESSLWKAVVVVPAHDPSGSQQRVYHASHRCIICNRDGKICINRDHIILETLRHNQTVRKSHHNGQKGCWCPLPCIGPYVQLRKLARPYESA